MVIATYGYSGVAGATPLHVNYPPGMLTHGCTTLPHLTRYTCSAWYGHVVLIINYWSYTMTTTANVRMTAGTLLGTVNEAATTVADTFGTATKAVGMLNRYVTKLSDKQIIRDKLDMHTFTKKLAEETAMADAVRAKGIKEFCKDAENQQLYSAAYDEIVEILSKN